MEFFVIDDCVIFPFSWNIQHKEGIGDQLFKMYPFGSNCLYSTFGCINNVTLLRDIMFLRNKLITNPINSLDIARLFGVGFDFLA